MDKIAIIGYGKMGEFFAKEFSKRFEVGIYSRHLKESEFELFNSIEELFKRSKYIMVATSLQETPKVLEKLAEFSKNNEGKVIFDISTFKGEVIEIYKKFPKEVKVCSIHPLFGSGAKSLKGRKIIVIPIEGRENDAKDVVELFKSFEAEIFISDAETHDEMMKIVIGIPYFMGLSFLSYISKFKNIEKFEGTSFEYLSIYGKAILNDSSEFIKEVLEFSENRIEEFLGFAKGDVNIEELKERYKDEIKESYRRFYKVLNED